MYLAYKKEYLNKILFIVLLTIFIIMCLVSPCFANDSIVFSNGETFPYVLPNDLLDNYVISYYTSNGIDNSVLDILAWDNTTKIVVDDTGGFKKYSIDGVEGEGTVYKYRYYPDGSCFPNYSVSSSSSGFEFIFNSSYAYYISPGAVVYNSSGDIIAEGENTFKEPYIINTQEELESGKFDTLNINSADLIEEEFYLFSYYYSDNGEIENIYPRKEILLDGTQNNYYVGTDIENGGYIYEIPFSQLGIDLVEGKKYGFKLATKDENGNVTKYYSEINFTIGTVSSEDVTNSKLEEQTDAIKENTETNKGIWESIKEILSYLNPFSENFFVYKLIELLVEAIKSLFIPSDDFFSTYFTDLKEWFSDRLGFLFYPFELLIDILNEILNIDFSNPIFNIPDIVEPFSNKKLINATTFNLNDLLNNSVWNTIHSIYLVCVDAFVVFGLVALFRKKYEEVTTK